MRIVRFLKNNTQRVLGAYCWDDLSVPRRGQDYRFRFRTNRDDARNEGFMMDFDNMKKHEGERLLDMAYQVLGDIRMYSVFTGGGHHIYVPVEEGIAEDEYPCYRTSYTKAMERFKEWLPSTAKIDTQPFTFHATGRVPGSLNSRRGGVVCLVDGHEGGTVRNLGELFSWEEPPKKTTVSVHRTGGSCWRPDKFCPFVMKGLEGGEPMGEGEWETWKVVTGVLAAAGRDEEARDLARKTGRMDKVEGLLKNRGNFAYTCRTVKEKYSHKLEDACDGCVHGETTGCMPSFVSGPAPTPAAGTGFHLATKDGINPKRIDVFSVVNHWSNLYCDRIIVEGVLYGWEGRSYERIGDLDATGTKFPVQVTRELRKIPMQNIQYTANLTECVSQVRTAPDLRRCEANECDNPNYINLSNGVFNLVTMELEAHDPKYMMLHHTAMGYDPEAECPRFMEFLDEALEKPEDQLLLQVFCGLAMSNAPCEESEQCLWMSGPAGTGKTTIYRLLEMLLGDKMMKIGRRSLPFREGGMQFNPTGKSCVFVEDVKTDERVWKDVEEFVTQYLSTQRVPVRMLYRDTRYTCPKGALIFTSNDAPEFGSTQDGGFRRIRMLMFYKRPDKPDPRLMDKFREEREGIFLWALEGWKYYKQHGMPEESAWEKESKKDVEETVHDPLEVWCGGVRPSPEGTPVSVLHQHFLKYAATSEREYSLVGFSKKLRKYLPGILRKHPSQIFRRTAAGSQASVEAPSDKKRIV